MSSGRISGISSGLDTEQIVNDLMKVERKGLDKMEQDKQTLEWKRDDYREMNKILADFEKTIFDGVLKQDTFNEKIVTSSNSSAVTATNINSTTDVNSTIRVDQLAESAYMNSSGDIRGNTNFDPNGNLATERSNLATDFTSNTFTIQSVNKDGTLGAVQTFTIDPVNDSLNDVLDRINKSDAGVSVFYDDQTGRISMASNNTGDVAGDAEIKVTGDFLTGSLGLDADNVTATANGRGNEGKNAKFQFNGLDTERSSNTFRINGYDYTLHQVTDDGDGVTETGELVTINSTTDVDTIYKSIEDFVNKYNETIEKINAELDEEQYRDYKPLTDEERAALSDHEIELWEDKAKSGMLRSDPTLTRSLDQMRRDLYTPVTGADSNYDQLSEIGITTSSNYRDKGKLEINEDKLRQAIADDPMAVSDLFNKDGDTYEEKGVARRLRDTTNDTIKSIEAKAGNEMKTNDQYSIGRELDRLDERIAAEEARLIDVENRYWDEFTYMEQQVDYWQSQGDYLAQLNQDQESQ